MRILMLVALLTLTGFGQRPGARESATWKHLGEKYDADKEELISEGAALAYPIRNGIPVMLVDEARKIE